MALSLLNCARESVCNGEELFRGSYGDKFCIFLGSAQNEVAQKTASGNNLGTTWEYPNASWNTGFPEFKHPILLFRI